MGEGLFQPLHILLIIGIALLVFGTSKFAALRNFKSAMKEGEEAPKEVKTEVKKETKEEEKKS
jgi:Sec-independent protein translocase protein TatA